VQSLHTMGFHTCVASFGSRRTQSYDDWSLNHS
jgi:regulator of replication initiation timing